MLPAEISLWTGILLVGYIFFGYPLSLELLARFKRKPAAPPAQDLPRVALVISAYNEQDVIEQKLHNTLAIDYPEEMYEIWVISDGSTDRTDDLVKAFNHPHIHLNRIEGRKGKTEGITQTMQLIDADIVVFSDANALYDTQAIRQLVKHFGDPQVGYVVGHARYVEDGISAAGNQENAYWSMEVRLKQNESRLASVVGGDGAIYAIRRKLFLPLDAEDINDFVNPLQIILQGYRGIFEPAAICYEHTAESFSKEFKRKRRIVNRSWRGLWKNAAVLNPFRTGIHAWQVFSHKLLRWLGTPVMLLILVSNLLLMGFSWIYCTLLSLQILAYLMAFTGWLMDRRGEVVPGLLGTPYYFFMVNFYSLLGIMDAFRGKKYTTWQTIREEEI